MQVILQPLPSGTPIPLTGDKPSEGVSGGVITPSKLIEEINRIRAKEKKYRDRENLSHTVEFSVFREHADEARCQVYVLTHAQSLPASVDAIFRIQRFSGITAGEFRLNNAVVAAQLGEWNGVSTTFRYQIHGGLFTI